MTKKTNHKRTKLIDIEKKIAADTFEREGFEAMVEYIHSVIDSYVLTKTWCIDILYDFEPTFTQIKEDKMSRLFGNDKRKKQWNP